MDRDASEPITSAATTNPSSLVPKLCLETLSRKLRFPVGPSESRVAIREAELPIDAFPSGAWERGTDFIALVPCLCARAFAHCIGAKKQLARNVPNFIEPSHEL